MPNEALMKRIVQLEEENARLRSEFENYKLQAWEPGVSGTHGSRLVVQMESNGLILEIPLMKV